MIWIAFIFTVGIILVLITINDWRKALRITIPMALVIMTLVGLIFYQEKREKQQQQRQQPALEEQQIKSQNAPATADVRKQTRVVRRPQRFEPAEEKQRRVEELRSPVNAFYADNGALIELYFQSASKCHSGLIFEGRMEESQHCKTAIDAKDRLQKSIDSLDDNSRRALKSEVSTAMWKIEYADKQLESARQISKRR